MDTSRVLFFLDLLSSNTSGHGEELADMYRRALDENDDVKTLRSLYEDCVFYGELGRSASGSAEQKLKSVYVDVHHALDILSDIKIENEAMLHEIARCDTLMRSPYPFRDSVTILKKKSVPGYMEALTAIAGACVYMILVYKGPEGIKYLQWEDKAGFREKLYAVNTKFLPAVLELRTPGYYWVIKRNTVGGKALFGGHGFYLSMEPARDMELMARAYQTERVGTHAYLNVGAFSSGENDVPLCWGAGNLTSLTPAIALQALGNSLITGLRTPNFMELQRQTPSPSVLMQILSDRHHYCITPDELVKAMNQWQAGHEIESRKAAGRCLFCGRQLRRKTLVCPEHFSEQY